MQNITTKTSGEIIDSATALFDQAKEQVQAWIPEKMNISDVERSVSGVIGTALAAFAVSRFLKSDYLFGSLALIGGAGLLTRGATGKCPVSKAMGLDTRTGGNVEGSSEKLGTSSSHDFASVSAPKGTLNSGAKTTFNANSAPTTPRH
ncbi:MAG: DUF2892 domain-containing protein [Bdellovibrionota bacterium]